jgi:hypothetical protein
MVIYNNNSVILKLKILMGLIQNLNRVNQNHSYAFRPSLTSLVLMDKI